MAAVTLDCPDPPALAAFYREATGLPLHPSSDAEFAGLTTEAGLLFGFQLAPDHRPPTWPDPAVPQQAHLCFDVDDLDAAQSALLDLGATVPAAQPDPGRYRVLLDPAGHPFCLSPRG
ncbi:VOC family protein [Streptacidiphilus anmyonensis]|uniref:VOC family protein n=1 Tax=Streptacidiphilus anmyonensis TaxID=405782 RepID=UPI0009FFE3D3|nr:VOC family protein [Streptacidiphilus anmyonensis]